VGGGGEWVGESRGGPGAGPAWWVGGGAGLGGVDWVRSVWACLAVGWLLDVCVFVVGGGGRAVCGGAERVGGG